MSTDTELPVAEQSRPEAIKLTDEQQKRIRKALAARGSRCGSCGGKDFEVGDALYLGFLFLMEDQDAYMVAVTCTTPECTTPHTGLRLRRSEFFGKD